MKYIEFKNQIRGFPVFSTNHLTGFGKNVQVLRNQLTGWRRKGLVIRLRKGLYILNEADRRLTPSRMFLANQFYVPSYISAEYALHFYDLIPERVADLTSVAPMKTAAFENPFGRFLYQQIKASAFTGYRLLKDENDFNIHIAEPEKALLDYLYLNHGRLRDAAMIVESLRLQNLDILDRGKLTAYAALFGRTRVPDLTKQLIAWTQGR